MRNALPLFDLLVSRIQQAPNGCWLWTGEVGRYGYGRISHPDVGKCVAAHRVAFEQFVAAIPLGLDIDHLCRTRRCVNPTHMEPVTRGVNSARGIALRPKKLTADAVRVIRTGAEPDGQFAQRFGVSPTLVWKVRTGRLYQSVG